jgi:hypothetical protein
MGIDIAPPRKGYKFFLQILIEIKVFCASPRSSTGLLSGYRSVAIPVSFMHERLAATGFLLST